MAHEKFLLVSLLVVCQAVVGWAWLFRRGGGIRLADERNCFCKAVNNHNYNTVFKDFGSIQKCKGFPTCACRRQEMITCGVECERKVQEWVCHHNCGGSMPGAKVRASYDASSCHSNRGRDIFVCGQTTNCGHK